MGKAWGIAKKKKCKLHPGKTGLCPGKGLDAGGKWRSCCYYSGDIK